MTLAILSHPDCVLHDAGDGHPECPERVMVIQHELAQYSFPTNINFLVAPLAAREQLIRVHGTDYVDWIFSIAPEAGMLGIDADTWMNPHTLTAALRAAGSVVQAVDLVLKDEAQAVFCNVRPPGHHAERDKAMGFCFFNNVAVGVAHAQAVHGIKRVAIIDFDVHHGNGTQQIFQDNADVLYCSSFEHPFYPGYESERDNAHLLSVPLPAGTGGADFRAAVADAWFEKIAAFQPQLIFFSAGFDAHADDPLADFKLHQDDYVWLTKQIANIAKVHCEGRLISVLEGGYNLRVLAQCVPAHVAAMII